MNKADSDDIDLAAVSLAGEKEGLTAKQTLAVQVVACQKSGRSDFKINCKAFKAMLEKQAIDQTATKKQPEYPDDDMLDGWDEDFDVKEQITPRDKDAKAKTKEEYDDYDDFEEEKPSKPSAKQLGNDKDLDDYLEGF